MSLKRWSPFSFPSYSSLSDLSTTANVEKSAECRQLKPGSQTPVSHDEVKTPVGLLNEHSFLESIGFVVTPGKGKTSLCIYPQRTIKS